MGLLEQRQMQKWRKPGSEEGQTNETVAREGHGIKGHMAETPKRLQMTSLLLSFSSFYLPGRCNHVAKSG